MATLILTAAGTAIGGPIGGALGALLGQQIDGRLFAPKARQGPRLGELAVQTSSYGTAIPKIFGRMRVAGTVIWATDLREERSSSGGGKGQPKTVGYSYSASFAVALSGRPLRGIGRIWADGKLLRGAAGDFKSATVFRFYAGDEEQPVDPLIASAEGQGQAPAYRGVAYAVFEDFALADYGNRIPSLSFEVEADPGPVAIGSIAEALSEGAVAAGATVDLAGYAASGDSVRGALEALGDVAPLWLAESAGRPAVTMEPLDPPLLLGSAEAGAAAGEIGGRSEAARQAAGSLPALVSLAYYDVERDYQTGLQRAVRAGEPGIRTDHRPLPAAMTSDAAKALAERRLAALWAGRRTATLHLAWRQIGLAPGAAVRLAGCAGLWRVKRSSLEKMVVTLELAKLPPAQAAAVAAGAGRPVAERDRPHGPTSLRLLDLPLPGGSDDRPLLLALAAGREEVWRRAELAASFDGGASWEAKGRTAPPAILGHSIGALPPVGSALFDERSSLEVELLHEGMWLEGRSDAALLAGANLAAVGEELLQFGRVEPLGGGRFRLSHMLRGRRGTEWAAAAHQAGDPFALLDADTATAIDVPLARLGSEVRLVASGLGDTEEPAQAQRVAGGEGVRPPSPVHLRAELHADGSVAFSWVRRSRLGWDWLDGGDAPLVEESEAYRLTLSAGAFQRTVTIGASSYLYMAAEQAADGWSGPLTVSVVQLGTLAASRPAQLTLV
jgi:hypothetical protein